MLQSCHVSKLHPKIQIKLRKQNFPQKIKKWPKINILPPNKIFASKSKFQQQMPHKRAQWYSLCEEKMPQSSILIKWLYISTPNQTMSWLTCPHVWWLIKYNFPSITKPNIVFAIQLSSICLFVCLHFLCKLTLFAVNVVELSH